MPSELLVHLPIREEPIPSSHTHCGHLVIIGGGERPLSVMQKIVELAGGAQARMVVISTASEAPKEVALLQQCELRALGAGHVDFFCCAASACAEDLARLRDATGVFFSGGDQRKLAQALLGTQLLEAIRDIYRRGGVIAGTSAGAAVMSKLMITGDEHHVDGAPDGYDKFIHTADGFGFMEGVIIDQHFVKRSRHYRLRQLIGRHPELIGIGIDEATAIVVSPDGIFSTIGESQVLVFSATPHRQGENSASLGIAAVEVAVLTSGAQYCLNRHCLLPSHPMATAAAMAMASASS